MGTFKSLLKRKIPRFAWLNLLKIAFDTFRLLDAVAKSLPRASASSVETTLSDYIRIEQLELSARIGVTETERAQPQRLSVSLSIWPVRPFVDLADDVRNTINYSEVCQETKNFIHDRADKLIETLADALASHLLKRFAMYKITIEVRKFVVPDTKFVAVSITRTTAGT